ncbi:hypothetical protein BC833DRAFT_572878, partial [Globomyces pollinis-pini]
MVDETQSVSRPHWAEDLLPKRLSVSNFSFMPSNSDLLQGIIIMSSLNGLFGAIWILSQRVSNPKSFSNPMGRIILSLAFSDVLNSLITITSKPGKSAPLEHTICQFQGAAMYLANLSSAFLGLALALNSFYIVILNGNTTSLLIYQAAWIGVSFVIPFFMASLPFLIYRNSFYGPTDLWCWISDPIMRIEYFYGIIWFMILLNILASIATWNALRQIKKSVSDGPRNRLMRLILGYSFAIIIAWIPGSLNRINEALDYVFGMQEVFQFMQAIIQPARGMLDAIAFYYMCDSSEMDTIQQSSISNVKSLSDEHHCQPFNHVYSLNGIVNDFKLELDTSDLAGSSIESSIGHSSLGTISIVSNGVPGPPASSPMMDIPSGNPLLGSDAPTAFSNSDRPIDLRYESVYVEQPFVN